MFKSLNELKQQKDYKLYFSFALIQLHILNDRGAYELHIEKMRSIVDMKKVWSKNHGGDEGSLETLADTSCFMIVNANGSNFGKIILSNNNTRTFLGHSEAKMAKLKMEDLMPTPILLKHPAFIKRFNNTGQSYIINNKATMFVKKANGYVVPVEIYIKFHFSTEYKYTFLAIVKPYTQMRPFHNEQSYKLDQLLFLIADNDIEGLVTEYSQSFPSQMKSLGLDFRQETTNITKRVTDLFTDLDFTNFRNTRRDRMQSGEIYEAYHSFDLDILIGETGENIGDGAVNFKKPDPMR